MPGSEASHAALDALWARMVEVAEAGNDAIVLGQAAPNQETSARVAALAAELASLAQAAATLARSIAHETL